MRTAKKYPGSIREVSGKHPEKELLIKIYGKNVDITILYS